MPTQHRSDPPQVAEPVGINGYVELGQIAPFAACQEIDAIIARLRDPVVFHGFTYQSSYDDPFLDVGRGPEAANYFLRSIVAHTDCSEYRAGDERPADIRYATAGMTIPVQPGRRVRAIHNACYGF